MCPHHILVYQKGYCWTWSNYVNVLAAVITLMDATDHNTSASLLSELSKTRRHWVNACLLLSPPFGNKTVGDTTQ